MSFPLTRIGILGGTFDPPHLGHLILAEEAFIQLELDLVLFLITPFPPHKTDIDITPLDHRLKMLELAIRDNTHFSISSVDIDRSPPHYAVDSLLILRGSYPEARIYYLMGWDSLCDLPHWYQPELFLMRCDGIGVMQRAINEASYCALEEKLPGIQQKVIFLNAPRFDISSREIRQRVERGLPFRYFLPESVYKYIQAQKLYRKNAPTATRTRVSASGGQRSIH